LKRTALIQKGKLTGVRSLMREEAIFRI